MNRELQLGQPLESKKEIQKILIRLAERATPITIHPNDSTDLLTTYVEVVKSEMDMFVLDSPLPSYRQPLLKDRNLTLTTRHNGCLLTFLDVEVKCETEPKTNTQFFSVRLPEKIYLLQRRQSFRAPVRPLLEIFAQLPFEEKRIHGRLKDLSICGCCIELSGNITQDFINIKEHLPLSLSFPNGIILNVDMSVVRVEYNPVRNNTSLGCCFLSLTSTNDHRISEIVADLQRDYINHSRHPSVAKESPTISIASGHKMPASNQTNLTSVELTLSRSSHSPKQVIAPVDIKKAYHSAIISVQTLINHFKTDKPLPFEQASESCHQLLTALRQDRQSLIILSRIRDTHNYPLQHSVSFAVNLADVVIDHYGNQVNDVLLERILLGGLCHHVAQASLPRSMQRYDLVVEDTFKSLLIVQMQRFANILNEHAHISNETLFIVRDCQEHLDGTGLPNGMNKDSLNRVSKLASVMYEHEKISQHCQLNDWSYHPLHSFKHLLDRPEKFHNPSVRILYDHSTIYPLGSLIKLNNNTLALVMRHDEDKQPLLFRTVFNIKIKSLVPPQDLSLDDDPLLCVEKAVNPIKFGISSSVLKQALKT